MNVQLTCILKQLDLLDFQQQKDSTLINMSQSRVTVVNITVEPNANTPSNSQVLNECLQKFKKVLSKEKYDTIQTLVSRLQKKEITRDEFDKKYFTIMLPYVVSTILPERFRNKDIIHVSPFRLYGEAKNQFVRFFELSPEERGKMLEKDAALVSVIRRFVELERQKCLELSELEGNIHIEGEHILPQANAIEEDNNVENKNEESVSKKRSRNVEEENSSKKRRIDKSMSLEEEESIENLRKEVEIYKKKLDEQQKQLDESNKMNLELKKQMAIYKEGDLETIEKFTYDEITLIFNTLCENSKKVSSIMRRKHEEEENDKYKLHCMICFENKKNVIFRPCSHIIQCDTCPIPKECFICKKKIEIAAKVYF